MSISNYTIEIINVIFENENEKLVSFSKSHSSIPVLVGTIVETNLDLDDNPENINVWFENVSTSNCYVKTSSFFTGNVKIHAASS